MNRYNARSMAATIGLPGQNRPATSVLYDAPDARVVLFRIDPGQEVAAHTSSSTVMLSVVAGSGLVSGANETCAVREGDVAVFEPHESHGMRAVDESLVIIATITPRPGSRAAPPPRLAGE